MFEQISNQAVAILSISIGGVSIASILATAISLIKSMINLKKEGKQSKEETKQLIEEAFKDAVLPKNIKLDVSNKIEKPIKEGLEIIQQSVNDALARVDDMEKLILSILSQFSHVQKLPEDVQKKIDDYVYDGVTEEVQL